MIPLFPDVPEALRCRSVLVVGDRDLRCCHLIGHRADGAHVFAFHLHADPADGRRTVWTDADAASPALEATR